MQEYEKHGAITICRMEQRTPGWFAARAGRVTGSEAKTVRMAKSTAGRKTYMRNLAVERITGLVAEFGFVSKEMQHGIDKEPLARMAVEEHLGIMIRETGFLRHDIWMIGSSLDGDTNNLELITEIKCPNSATHIGYLDDDILPKEYEAQCMHNLLVSGASQIIFASFDDRLPEGLQLFTKIVNRSDLPMAEYEKDLFAFIAEVDDLEVRLRSRQTYGDLLAA